MTTPQHMAAPVTVFCSYSHKDEALKDQLLTHLKGLERGGAIGIWHDRRILPGSDWASEIDSHLEEANVILLLVSANFIASEYCSGIELQRALSLHASNSARVIPVILKDCDWKIMSLRTLQALPKDGKAITRWTDRDAALTEVAQGIRRAVEELNAVEPGPVPPPVKPPVPPRVKPPEEGVTEPVTTGMSGNTAGKTDDDGKASMLQPGLWKRLRDIRVGIVPLIGLLAIIAFAFWVWFAFLRTEQIPFQPNKIKIVSSLPQTGTSSRQSKDIEDAIQMALDEHDGHVLGYPVEYVRWDDSDGQKWDKDKEIFNAHRAADDPSVMMYIGPFNSGAAIYSIPILNEAGLPMISPSNTVPALTRAGFDDNIFYKLYPDMAKRNYFRLAPTDDLQGKQAAVWSRSITFGLKKVYVLHDQQPYGKFIAETFAEHFESLGGEVWAIEGIVPISGGTPTAGYLEDLGSRIRDSGTELVYFGGAVDTGAKVALEVVRNVAPGIEFMGPDAIQTQQFIASNGNATGVLATAPGMPYQEYQRLRAEKGAKFYRDFKKKYGDREPDPYAIYGYEAMKVTLHVMEQIQRWPDRDSLRLSLAKIVTSKNYEGALGKWHFTPNGDISEGGFSLYEVKDGKFEFIKYKRVVASDSTFMPSSLPSPPPSRAASSTAISSGPQPAEQTAAAKTPNSLAHATAKALESQREQTPIELGVDQVTYNGNGQSETLNPVQNLNNFQLQVQFENPRAAPWDYGVVFRRADDTYQLYMTSFGQWYLIVNGVVDTIGKYEPMHTVKANTNELKFYLRGNVLNLYINNDWIEDVVLSSDMRSLEIPTSGTLSIATGFQEQTPGTLVKVLNFKLWRLP